MKQFKIKYSFYKYNNIYSFYHFKKEISSFFWKKLLFPLDVNKKKTSILFSYHYCSKKKNEVVEISKSKFSNLGKKSN